MRSFFLFLFVLQCKFSFAQTPWPQEVYQSYFNNCKASLLQQGSGDRKATGMCYCLASAFSKEFGMEQYNHLRSAQPNPNGSVFDKKLYQIFKKCS